MPAVPRARPLQSILLRLVLIAMLPLGLLSAYGIADSLQAQRQQLAASTHEVAKALSTALRFELEATESVLGTLARSPALQAGDVQGFYALAQSEVAARSSWFALILADAQGNLVFKTSQPFGAPGARIVEPDSLREAMRLQRPVVGTLARGPIQGAAFAVRLPVLVHGQLRYVLSASVKPDRILELVRRQQVPGDWVLSVFDQKNQRVARSRRHEETLGGRPSDDLLALMATAPPEGGTALTTSIEGQHHMTSFARLPATGWTVAVGAPVQPLHGLMQRSAAFYLFGTLLSALACVALARYVSRKTARAVADVRDNAARLGEGQPLLPAASHVVELNEMMQALSTASAHLQATTRSLREAGEAAAAASRAKDEFLAVLGHELRNPMAPMLTALHLMELKGDALTARERQVLRRQVDHMRRLVDDLLDVSRIVTGKLRLDRAPVALATVLERAVEAVEPAAEQRGGPPIALQLPALPLWVEGDETRLLQVVTNLLVNALRFGGAGPITLALQADGGRARISVRDQGEGMSAATLAQVFEPFYQAPQQPDRAHGGLGLGLAIVRAIAERHGGQVRAHSAGRGQGAVFDVELPLIEPPPPATAADEPEGRREGRVLLVDDNLDALQTQAEVLRIAGYEVRALASPEAALAQGPAFDPDVAVLDIGLPGIDGYELAQALRRAPGWRAPLVALTGYGRAADRSAAAQAGFAQHLTKPIEPALLLRTVQALLASATGVEAGAAPH